MKGFSFVTLIAALQVISSVLGAPIDLTQQNQKQSSHYLHLNQELDMLSHHLSKLAYRVNEMKEIVSREQECRKTLNSESEGDSTSSLWMSSNNKKKKETTCADYIQKKVKASNNNNHNHNKHSKQYENQNNNNNNNQKQQQMQYISSSHPPRSAPLFLNQFYPPTQSMNHYRHHGAQPSIPLTSFINNHHVVDRLRTVPMSNRNNNIQKKQTTDETNNGSTNRDNDDQVNEANVSIKGSQNLPSTENVAAASSPPLPVSDNAAKVVDDAIIHVSGVKVKQQPKTLHHKSSHTSKKIVMKEKRTKNNSDNNNNNDTNSNQSLSRSEPSEVVENEPEKPKVSVEAKAATEPSSSSFSSANVKENSSTSNENEKKFQVAQQQQQQQEAVEWMMRQQQHQQRDAWDQMNFEGSLMEGNYPLSYMPRQPTRQLPRQYPQMSSNYAYQPALINQQPYAY